MIFSHFVSKLLRLQVSDWHGVRPVIRVICGTDPEETAHRFMATFVTKDCLIKGLRFAAIRFLMTHVHTTWMLVAQPGVKRGSESWKHIVPICEATERLAKLERVFKACVRAVQIAPKDYQKFYRGIAADSIVFQAVLQKLTNLKQLDFTVSPTYISASINLRHIDAQPVFDLNQITTHGQLDLEKLKLVRCPSKACLYDRELFVKFQLEDAHDPPGWDGLLIATKDSKYRLITSLSCKICGKVLSR